MTAQPQTSTTAQKTTTATVWDLDPAHSRAEFAVKHMMIATVRGSIPVKSATVEHDPAAPQNTRVKAELDLAGINTGTADRDGHLRSADFFDVEKFPTMTFESTSFDGETLEGTLTIRGVARPVKLDVVQEGEGRDPWGNWKAGVTATTTINRADWGLTWNAALETGGVLVSDKVKVTLELQFAKRG